MRYIAATIAIGVLTAPAIALLLTGFALTWCGELLAMAAVAIDMRSKR